MNFKNISFLSSIFLLIISSIAFAKTFDDIGESKKWLNLIDSGKYSESWTETDSFFKQQITQEKWTQVIKNVRIPLGTIVSREKISSKKFTSLPNAPDGNYIVLQFKTAFQNKKDSTETLTFSYSNKRWSVIGYFIK